MNRRKFTKASILGTIASALPLSAFTSLPSISTLELLGKGNPEFTEDPDYKLRPEAAVAFKKMKEAASLDGVQLKVISSYRSYAHQNRIWERKYKRFRKSGLSPTQSIKKIIEYSTIPGTSRHHWGSDLDLIDGNPRVTGDVLVPSKFLGDGPFCDMKVWMDTNASRFDFHLVYTDAPARKGFKYEPWHYSYAPLSIPYLKKYQKLDIKSILEEGNLKGSEYFETEFIVRYLKENLLDINPYLLT